MQPQDSERENTIDDGCALMRTDADHGPCLRAAHQHAARVRRTEAALEVHRRAKAVDAPVREVSLQHSLQQTLIARAGSVACRGCSPLARTHQFEHLRLRVSE